MKSAALVILFAILLHPFLHLPAAAEAAIPGADKHGANDNELQQARADFGLEAFKDWRKVGQFLLVILGAAALGAILAYHPSASHKGTIEDLDQPKIMILYTVIGSLVGIVVAPVPAVGLAIFGIGGLMRFRTELGAAKETGRVILATILGISCGLGLWMVSIVSTIVAWILIYILEARVSMRLAVRGIRSDAIPQTAEAYGKALRKLKCSFSTPRKNPAKGQVSFVLRAPRGIDREEIEARLNSEVPKELKGTIDWPED